MDVAMTTKPETVEQEALRVFGACGGKCGEAPCVLWNQNNDRKQRRKNVREIMWSQGYGYGICTVASTMLAALSHPDKDNPDWTSVVTVSGPPKKYTNEELRKIVAFSRERTERYDKMFSYRMGANLIVIDKVEEGRWLRKRQSWDHGPMYSKSLDEALEVFRERE